MTHEKYPVIAIDGHSSCGKSTLAKALASHLHYTYIDTGAMYRAVTLYALSNQLIHPEKIDTDTLQNCLENGKIQIDFSYNPEKRTSETLLNGENVESQIREMQISESVGRIAALPFVREALVNLQRQTAKKQPVVMDGRDIGTHVFPEAEAKIFLTARPEIRAERRYKELINKGKDVSFKDVLHSLQERDRIDTERKTNPLRRAEDAFLLDNSNINQAEQKASILEWLQTKNIRVQSQ
ncbi:MAG: cytidylate kinase [Bacteroidia bacterium]|nr:MAG: cytidylate kinase [Bacteroidia bacterium]